MIDYSMTKANNLEKLIETMWYLYDKHRGMTMRTKKPHYRKRNIKVDATWQGSMGKQRFIKWALLSGFELGKRLEIDRTDNDKNYGPHNCQWVNRSQNGRNTSSSITIIFRGKPINMKTLSETRHCKVSYETFCQRLRRNWPLEEALAIPSGERCKWSKTMYKKCVK